MSYISKGDIIKAVQNMPAAKVSADKRSEIIEYCYMFNVRADIKIEDLVDDIICMIEGV